jgi:hypothetical protein
MLKGEEEKMDRNSAEGAGRQEVCVGFGLLLGLSIQAVGWEG